MNTQAQQSVILAQIRAKLEESKRHADYAAQLHSEAFKMIPEFLPVASIVTTVNGERSIVCGHKGDVLCVTSIGCQEMTWKNWNCFRPVGWPKMEAKP